jgi:ribosomal protein S18 acetylase RimI-like enzyme
MTDFQIQYLDTLPDTDEQKIRDGHIADEAAQGIVCNYKPFSLVIKDNTDVMIGALCAYTAFAEIYVNDLWIAPAYRKQGLARRLMFELENNFKGKGYNNINLVTSEFQAVDFYKKCGYEIEFVRINMHNPKLTKYFFVKFFEDEIQRQGILE